MSVFLDDYHIDIQRGREFAPQPVWEWRVLHRWTGHCHGEGRSDAGFARACGDAMLVLIGETGA
ncbi:hypothetical protein [Asticcacaulis solisilvae]|uniref:hypothetical protein n=1 Tax=Asticcacaulis solisilvae TaxID=1217274 RepID=UPI003FD714BD